MKINQRALEVAACAQYESFSESVIGCCEEPWEKTPESYRHRLTESARVAIEAYEAAKPSPWIALVDLPRDGSWIQVWFGESVPGPIVHWTEQGWRDVNWTVWGEISLGHAQFRTIDPPSGAEARQNAQPIETVDTD